MPLSPALRAGRFVAGMAAITVLISASPSGQRPPAQPGADSPRLVVLLVVDQMRADYVDRFEADWTSGLKQLATHGARFTQAAYPYLATYTCAGHATVGTGAFPHVHGIFQNTWYDPQRNPNETIPCTDDPQARPLAYGGQGRADGPGRLRAPTLADEMRSQRASKVVTLALKARSAIMLAGHGGDAVTWMTEDMDGWQTSSAYTERLVPEVKAYLEAHPVDADFGAVWERLLPADRYPESDYGEAEAPIPGWTIAFPHKLAGAGTAPDRRFHDQWQHSPFADAYVGRMAAALVERLGLGRRGSTDLLGVSFSSTDLVGHQFGPHSQEVRDMYARLDRTIGELFSRLDALVGHDQWVVGLTADHGVTDIPEQLVAHGVSAGRLAAANVRNLLDRTVAEILGSGQYVARVNTNDIYFRPGIYEQLQRTPGAMQRIIKALLSQDGIDRVYRRDEIANAAASSDRVLRAAALSYVPDRSGDLLIVTKPGWMFSANGTTHGSANPDDQRVPLMFFGRGIKPGVYRDAASPADVAPTLAALAGVSLANAEGQVLRSALRRPPAPLTTK